MSKKKALKRPAATARRTLKRPAASGAAAKRPAAAVLEAAGVSLAPRAPAYLPSRRPAPEKLSDCGSKAPPLAQRRCVEDASFRQSGLRALQWQTPPLLQLHLRGSGVRRPAVLDFAAKDLALLELRELVIQNWPLKTGVFERRVFPKLRSLQIAFPFDSEPGTPDDWDSFSVALPELTELVLEHPGAVKPAELRASTQACPKLNYLCLYKVYVETLSVVVPNAEFVWLHRMEFLKHVSVYGPRLKELRLQACYDLNRVNILQKAPGVAPPQAPSSTFAVDLTNSCVPQEQIEALREHPRVGYVVVPGDEHELTEDEPASSGRQTVKIGHFMAPPGLSKMQLNAMYGLEAFGKELGVNVCEKVKEARSVKVEHMARMLEWGARAVYVWWKVQVSDDALALARRAGVPVKFWDAIVAAARSRCGRAVPGLAVAEDLERCVRDACA